MKKSILTGSVSLALVMFSNQLVAQEIVVNTTVVDGVTLQDFTYDAATNRLTITTSDVTQSVQLADGATEPTDPEPTDPEPTDPEPTDPEPTDPAPTGVEIRYNISDLMVNTGYVDMSVSAGTTLASRFVVPTDSTFRGAEFKLQNITNNRTRAWVSSEPGGTRISGCDLTSSFSYRMTFSLPTGSRSCKLQSGSVYYLNLKNADSSTVGAAVTRQINLDIETPVIEFDWSAFM